MGFLKLKRTMRGPHLANVLNQGLHTVSYWECLITVGDEILHKDHVPLYANYTLMLAVKQV